MKLDLDLLTRTTKAHRQKGPTGLDLDTLVQSVRAQRQRPARQSPPPAKGRLPAAAPTPLPPLTGRQTPAQLRARGGYDAVGQRMWEDLEVISLDHAHDPPWASTPPRIDPREVPKGVELLSVEETALLRKSYPGEPGLSWNRMMPGEEGRRWVWPGGPYYGVNTIEEYKLEGGKPEKTGRTRKVFFEITAGDLFGSGVYRAKDGQYWILVASVPDRKFHFGSPEYLWALPAEVPDPFSERLVKVSIHDLETPVFLISKIERLRSPTRKQQIELPYPTLLNWPSRRYHFKAIPKTPKYVQDLASPVTTGCSYAQVRDVGLYPRLMSIRAKLRENE
jgi:hypothetical protein